MPFRQNMKNQKIEATISGMLMASKGKQSKALKVNEIKSAFNKLNEMDKAKFTASLILAQDLHKLKPLFDEFCKAVKNKLKDEGFTAKELPNQDAIIWAVYGITKSWFHRLVKVGGIAPNIVNKFIAKCDEMEANGETPTRSIDALNTWAKSYDDHKGEADTDGESLSDLRDGGERREVAWGIKSGKLKLNFFTDGTSETNFTDAEINELLVRSLPISKASMRRKRPPLNNAKSWMQCNAKRNPSPLTSCSNKQPN
jgi:hypothetical protein